MRQGVFKIQELLDAAWEEQKAEAEKQEAALAAARAEKAAPGSKIELERADAIWTLLRGAVAAASEWCTEAVYPPPRPAPAVGFSEEAQS